MVSSLICFRWHPWALPSVCNAGASEQHLYLHRWCGQVNALQLPALAEYCKDRDSLVYIQSTPPSASRVTYLNWHRESHASFRCPPSRHLHVRWCVNEHARLKDCSCLFCESASTAEYSSISFALRSTVTGFVSCCTAWTMATQRCLAFHAISLSGCTRCRILQLIRCYSACVFCIEVRPHHSTPDTVALAEAARAHQV